MKPKVSPFSMARETRVMARLPMSARTFRGRALLIRACRRGPEAGQCRARSMGMRSLTLARGTVEQVVGDDFVVVVRGVGEGGAAVAIAEREDVRNVGAELIVDGDVSARVGFMPAAARLRSSVLGTRPTASSTWEPSIEGRVFIAVEADGDLSAFLFEVNAGRLSCGCRCPRWEYFVDDCGGIFIFMRWARRGVLIDDGDFAAEAAKHLCELAGQRNRRQRRRGAAGILRDRGWCCW